MTPSALTKLVARLIAASGGSTEVAAQRLGTSPSNLSRWKLGHSRPRKKMEDRMRAIIEGTGDLIDEIQGSRSDARLKDLENAIARTLNELREEFHRSASVSNRQEVLDLVSLLFFAHVASVDRGEAGISTDLLKSAGSSVTALNDFVTRALHRYLDVPSQGQTKALFRPLIENDRAFATSVINIFERHAAAFRALHQSGRDDLINEVFSRFMSGSFVDEKEMGQYLTPPEVVRFMVELGYQSLTDSARSMLLSGSGTGLVLDPSCGVGSFLAEAARYFHAMRRTQPGPPSSPDWLSQFVEQRIVGIDKSERMIRLALINLGLFGVRTAKLTLGSALLRRGPDSAHNVALEGKAQLILTNPPFGATFRDSELVGYVAGGARTKAESELLFLERYIDWLADDGVVATVVPDSVLVNRGPYAELRSWLFSRAEIVGVFSLPASTFAGAGTSTKTSVLVLRKRRHDEECPTTYFGEARHVGFDVVTRNGQRRRVRTPQNDLPALLADFSAAASSLGRRRVLPADADRWDAPFHIGLPEHIATAVNNPDAGFIKVADIATLVDRRVDPRRLGNSRFKYVEISDIDNRTGMVGYKTLPCSEAPSRARRSIRQDDVLVSTVRPDRGAIGVVPSELDDAICSTGFAVLRCTEEVHPLALAWLLRSEMVQKQMQRHNVGIAYPAITEEACLSFVLPVSREALKDISAAAERLAKAQQAFDRERKSFSAMVLGADSQVAGDDPSSEVPDLVDSSEPRTVADRA